MNKVLVPIRLTEEMRERFGKIEDGPWRTYDEVWSELLDAAMETRPLISDAIAAIRATGLDCAEWSDETLSEIAMAVLNATGQRE